MNPKNNSQKIKRVIIALGLTLFSFFVFQNAWAGVSPVSNGNPVAIKAKPVQAASKLPNATEITFGPRRVTAELNMVGSQKPGVGILTLNSNVRVNNFPINMREIKIQYFQNGKLLKTAPTNFCNPPDRECRDTQKVAVTGLPDYPGSDPRAFEEFSHPGGFTYRITVYNNAGRLVTSVEGHISVTRPWPNPPKV